MIQNTHTLFSLLIVGLEIKLGHEADEAVSKQHCVFFFYCSNNRFFVGILRKIVLLFTKN